MNYYYNAAMMKKEPKHITEDILNETLASFFGQLFAYFDQRFDAMHKEMKQQTDELRKMSDAAEKRIERIGHESIALGAQVDRHEVWIQRVTDTATRSV
jgi:DNA-binding ferritin-like protein